MRKIIGFRTLCVGLGIWVGTVVVSAQGEFKALPWSQSTAYNSYLMRDVHRQFASRQLAIQQAFTSPAGMHILQQQHISSSVIQPFAAVAGGINAGAAVEGVHAEAGIISNGREFRKLTDGSGLQHSVFRKRGAGFLHLHSDSKLLGADNLYAELP